MKRLFLLFALTAYLLPLTAPAYDTPPPKYINAEITWLNPKTGKEQTHTGQFWFKDFPRIDERGRKKGFGKLGYYTGIKWFVPKEPGQIWMTRQKDATNLVFRLHHHFGDSDVVPAGVNRFDVMRTMESELNKHMDREAEDLVEIGKKAIGDQKTLDMQVDPDEVDSMVISTELDVGKKKGKEQPSIFRFATEKDIGVSRIMLTNVTKIVFLDAADGYQREVYRGRYVGFSNSAVGDRGRVQVKTATYFGGPDPNERFGFADFFSDDTILCAGDFLDLSFTDQGKITVLGDDPAPDAYPEEEYLDRKKRKQIRQPRRVATLVFFNPDLTKVEKILRLPWGTGTIGTIALSLDDKIYMTGQAGPHFEIFTNPFGDYEIVENPAELARLEEWNKRQRARNREEQEPGPDAYVMKIDHKTRKVEWVTLFKHCGLNLYTMPDGRLLVRRRDELLYISPDGKPSQGPRLDITGSNMAVDRRSGDMYFGGNYRSGTGLEPYVNPYLYKVNAQGKQVWTAYGWSGPIVGVEQLRLVSDSSVTRVKVAEDGSLTLTAWSDGGNTVISYQPYDCRQHVKTSGWCSSTWGATGGLTVRIAHIVHMDQNSMFVDHATSYVSYLPTSDVPTLLNIYDIHRTANGDVAVTGGSWTGYIETHDAWIKPWYVEYRTNEFAQAKGGTIFTLYKPDFSLPRMATRTPGVGGGQLAGKGDLLLLYCGNAGGDTYSPYQPIVRNALQPKNGGGSDGYAILIDTRGRPNPPVIPDWTWGKHAKKGGK